MLVPPVSLVLSESPLNYCHYERAQVQVQGNIIDTTIHYNERLLSDCFEFN